MKSKTYRYGNVTFKAIHKAVGNGWETTIWYAGKPIFVGNFIHAKEATAWWNLMNREINKFARKYSTGYKFPVTWFSGFLKTHLYKEYYVFLEKTFAGYHREFRKAFQKDFRKFKSSKKQYTTANRKVPMLKTA